jgi:hypothetical protein
MKITSEILEASLKKGDLCAMFVDAQGESMAIGHGLYIGAFDACETLRQTAKSHGLDRVWIVFAALDGNHQMTAAEFQSRIHHASCEEIELTLSLIAKNHVATPGESKLEVA